MLLKGDIPVQLWGEPLCKGTRRDGRAVGVVEIVPAFALCGPSAQDPCSLHPVRAEQLGLFQDGLDRFFLQVWRAAVLVQDALHDDSNLCPRTFAQGPVDGHADADDRTCPRQTMDGDGIVSGHANTT